jgi:lipopolysaccharide/colanic/teichoic acid biosynthesis glycosyltransferase
MSGFSKEQVQLKIAPESSEFIIGSDSKNEPGELFTLDVKYQLSEYHMLRRKRIFDVLAALLLVLRATLVLGYPLFTSARWRYVFSKIPQVLLGKKTWVSYFGQLSAVKLPILKPGIISSAGVWTGSEFEADVNHLYAKEYEVWRDLEILWDYLKNQ